MNAVTSTLQVAANLDELAQVRLFIEQTAVTYTQNQQTIDDIILAVDEAVTNIIRHGYQNQPGTIKITIQYQPTKLIIQLHDWSPNFDPTKVTSPDPNKPLSQRKPGGMGVHMMRHLTDELQYQSLLDGRNELILTKQL